MFTNASSSATVDGEKVRLFPNGRWEYVDPAKAEAARKLAADYPENQTRPIDSQGIMVGGIGPVVGVPLPFISYGGTSLFVSIASIGILMNIGEQAIKARREGTRTTPPPEKPAAPRLYLVKK